jgi:hypothetical protein
MHQPFAVATLGGGSIITGSIIAGSRRIIGVGFKAVNCSNSFIKP